MAGSRAKLILSAIGSVLSGVLLSFAFPPFEEPTSAWFAFVPLLVVCGNCRPGEAFRWGLVAGMSFWLVSISWLLWLVCSGGPLLLVVLAWIALSLYCSLYTALFALVAARVSALWRDARGWQAWLAGAAWVAGLPLVWVGLEYLRSVIFTGFAWNAVGISQYRNIAMIQMAAWGGVYAVSLVVMVMNLALSVTVGRFVQAYVFRQRSQRGRFVLGIGLGVVLLSLTQGVRVARRAEAVADRGTPVRISAVQPNVGQERKWARQEVFEIYRELEAVTELAGASDPDLIVWPETSLPGALPIDVVGKAFVERLAGRGVPLLIGAMELEKPGEADQRLYNASFLVATNGTMVSRYRKRHLVPFGEYLPLDKMIPSLQRLVPIGATCWPGTESTVFSLAVGGETGQPVTFASLICFEDAFPYLARDAVRNGARLLINQTNDAWFDGSAGSWQHMTHCVFRCVENRVPAVRSGNTGVTCFIDALGRIDATTLESIRQGSVTETTCRTARVKVNMAAGGESVYTRYGDALLAMPCAVLAMLALCWCVLAGRRRKPVQA